MPKAQDGQQEDGDAGENGGHVVAVSRCWASWGHRDGVGRDGDEGSEDEGDERECRAATPRTAKRVGDCVRADGGVLQAAVRNGADGAREELEGVEVGTGGAGGKTPRARAGAPVTAKESLLRQSVPTVSSPKA